MSQLLQPLGDERPKILLVLCQRPLQGNQSPLQGNQSGILLFSPQSLFDNYLSNRCNGEQGRIWLVNRCVGTAKAPGRTL